MAEHTAPLMCQSPPPDFTTFRPYLFSVLSLRYRDCFNDPELAEELAQETFLRAVQGWSSYRGSSPSALSGWLRSILHRCVLDHLRRSSSRPKATQPLPEALPDTASDPVERLIADEDRELVRRALARLSTVEQTVLEASFARVPLVEQARELGITVEAVRKRRRRAMRRLRAELVGATRPDDSPDDAD